MCVLCFLAIAVLDPRPIFVGPRVQRPTTIRQGPSHAGRLAELSADRAIGEFRLCQVIAPRGDLVRPDRCEFVHVVGSEATKDQELPKVALVVRPGVLGRRFDEPCPTGFSNRSFDGGKASA